VVPEASSSGNSSFSEMFLKTFPAVALRQVRCCKDEELNHLTLEKMKVIVDETKIHNQSQEKVAAYFGVSRYVIKRLQHALNEGKIFTTSMGRPSLISDARGKEIQSKVADKNTYKRSPNRVELKGIFLSAIKDSALDRGNNGISVKENISPNSLKKYVNVLGLKEQKGQKTTEARRKASLDIRNFISMAVMNEVCGDGLSFHCLGNMDATQFDLKFSDQGKVYSVGISTDPVTRTAENSLDLFVKQYFLVSSAGFLAPPLFIFSLDKILSEDEIIILEIKGLSFSFSGRSPGYIVFMRTRTCNDRFNQFLFRKYIVDFVDECRDRVEDAQAKDTFYLVIDGEAAQLSALDDPETSKIICDNNIDIGKGPASCSGICGNALDCGNVFKATKTSMKGKTGVGQSESPDTDMETKIVNAFNSNEVLKENLSSEKKKKYATAIVYLLDKELAVVTKDMIKEGFTKIGMTPVKTGPVSRLETTLSLCPSVKNITKMECDEIKNAFPNLVELFETNGEIKESEFDQFNVRKFEDIDGEVDRNTKEKDERVLHQQRAVLLTKDASINRRLQFKMTQTEKENKKANAPTAEERKATAEIRSLLNEMVKNVDEKIKQEKKSSREFEKKRLREEKEAKRKSVKEAKEKKRKIPTNTHVDDIQMPDSEDDIPLSKLGKK